MLIWTSVPLRRSQNTKLEVDRALDKANKTLHRLLEEMPLESEAVTKAAGLNSSQRQASLH